MDREKGDMRSASVAADSAPLCPAGVTIAIPHWNHVDLLPRSIASALRAVSILRTHAVPAEVLVVDDHSRDESLALLRQLEALYYQDGLHVLALARHGGGAVARNYALRHATYRSIVFMDARNELIPENIPTFYRAITQTGAAMVYGTHIAQGEDAGEPMLIHTESFHDRSFAADDIDAFALVDRLQLLDVGGYSEDARIHARESWELSLHLAACGRRIIFVPVMFGIAHRPEDSMIEEPDIP